LDTKEILENLNEYKGEENNNNKPFESKVYFIKTYNNINMQQLIDILANQVYEYSLIKINDFGERNNNQIKGFCFILQE
jgi:hypothetical protein